MSYEEPDVKLLRAVRHALSDVRDDSMKIREVADQLTAAIVQYVKDELCTCLSGRCRLSSHP